MIFKKAKSLRIKSGKRPGGQEGLEETVLYLNDIPNEIKIYSIEQCTECGASLKDVALKYIFFVKL
ncbi:ribosomal protein L34E [Clostridium pascui]|uniref:hypothetical protein n=1 Tax=Clostridium pascui TaxID=46609 RepID=UPI001FAF03A8|nr:hypothetical protein [Clostridium pascui]MBM7871838.1 ribosomal protein L34E [Clostridium pascui]